MKNLRIPGRLVQSVVCAWVACVLAAPCTVAAKTPGEIEVGQMLRDASMQGLNGPSKKLSEFRGKPLIINVWASWCGPCRAEMASLERLAWSEAAQQFSIIGVSTDDYPEAAKAWLKRSNATFNHYIDRNLELENLLGASRLPLTVLVDADGRVVDKIYGAREWDSADALKIIDRAFHRAKLQPPARR